MRASRTGMLAIALLVAGISAASSSAQEIDEETRARLEEWAEANPRQGGTERTDWRYTLPDGVTTRQVTYYSDDVACYAKLFFPAAVTPDGSWPGVVLGHGFNAVALAIEKYGAYFAERGLVAMVIDYRGYGFSDPFVSLLEPDTTTDEERITERQARVELKRTRLVAQMQAEDYRAAVSYLQGEPGVDPERIGIWGSSHAGGVVITVAGTDARVKAVVAQVSSVGGRGRTGPLVLEGELLEDAIARARNGRGAQFETGFSRQVTVDAETRQAVAEYRPFHDLDDVPESVPVLFIVAENEELMDNREHAYAAAERLAGETEVLEIPGITHFEVYRGEAFQQGPRRRQNGSGPGSAPRHDRPYPRAGRAEIGTRP